MKESHKQALAQGRKEGQIVRAYLEALELQRPKRGRKRSPESISRRLSSIKEELKGASGVDRLLLVQERKDLQSELDLLSRPFDIAQKEQEFIKVARAYGERKGLTWSAWREVGVPPSVLTKAGIRR
jgi:hypothetical protein